MRFCSHCGKEVNDSAEICMNCGCMVEDKFTLTFKRESQWFLINPPMDIRVIGENSNHELSVDSGEKVSIKLKAGTYNIHISSSIRTNDSIISLNKNVTYRLAWNRFSGKIEFWEI